MQPLISAASVPCFDVDLADAAFAREHAPALGDRRALRRARPRVAKRRAHGAAARLRSLMPRPPPSSPATARRRRGSRRCRGCRASPPSAPWITFAASSRFDSSSWSIRSSSVPVQMRLCTNTGLRWPTRCTRSVACCSTAGFHQRSKWKTWFAAGRFRPRPPALIEITSTDGPSGSSNASSTSSRCRAVSRPWKKPTSRAEPLVRDTARAGRSPGTA